MFNKLECNFLIIIIIFFIIFYHSIFYYLHKTGLLIQFQMHFFRNSQKKAIFSSGYRNACICEYEINMDIHVAYEYS